MKQVIFKRIVIRNFLSVGKEPIELLFQSGVSLVTGYNHDKDSRNGVGKSALCTDAIFFALFGTAMRKISKSKLPNRLTNERPIVELEFDVRTPAGTDSYILTRKMKPSRLFISRNGEDLSRTINKSTTEIQSIIDASPDVFRNCVIMSLNKTNPFMAQSKIDKRKFIEGILKLDVFSEMLLTTRKELAENNRRLDAQSTVMANLVAMCNGLLEQQTNQATQRDKEVAQLRSRIAENNALVAKIRQDSSTPVAPLDIEQYKQQISLLNTQRKKCDRDTYELIARKAQLTERLSGISREISSLQEGPSVCPTCKRAWENDTSRQSTVKKEMSSKKKTLKESAAVLQDVVDELEKHKAMSDKCAKGIDKLQSKLAAWTEYKNAVDHSGQRIQQLETFNKQIKQDIKALLARDDGFDALIEQTTEKIHQARHEVDQLEYNRKILENVKFVVSEEGVKSYIVRKMLKLFNSRLALYLDKFSANCSCTFDEYFAETIFDEYGNQVDYESFSAGEQKRIDLAMLFTFQDIRRFQSDTTINISVYDELFDSSLDTEGVQVVLELLKERSEKLDECTYVITHRADAAKLTDHISTIHLEKRDGITSVAQYENNT